MGGSEKSWNDVHVDVFIVSRLYVVEKLWLVKFFDGLEVQQFAGLSIAELEFKKNSSDLDCSSGSFVFFFEKLLLP